LLFQIRLVPLQLGLAGGGVAHPTYEFSGAPWFPATVLTAVNSDGSKAMPLGRAAHKL
jgi:hypothetical protein